MDNMLYIVAGLVLILLIAILVLRRNKTKQPAPSTPLRTNKETIRAVSVSSDRMPQPSVNSATKFDDITIAQRFIDQQRYDKAIEAIERGLMRKPHDEQLSLKLLSIYATTNELSEFNRVYDEIVQNNTQAIPQANELKSLLLQDQTTSAAAPVSSFDQSSVEAIDFDLPQSSVQVGSDTSAHEPVESVQNHLVESASPLEPTDSLDDSFDNLDLANFDTADSSYTDSSYDIDTISNSSMASDDIFELTLDDLEDNDSDTQESLLDDSRTETSGMQPVHVVDSTPLESLDSSDLDLDTNFDFDDSFDLNDEASTVPPVNEPASEAITNDDSFFDFDLQADSKSINTNNSDSNDVSQSGGLVSGELDVESNEYNDANDEDFVLDLADLETETETDDKILDTYAPSDSLTLSLDEDDTTQSDFVFEDSQILGSSVQDSAPVTIDNAAQGAGDQADTPMLFDDNTPIEDSFDFEDALAPTEAKPVEVADSDANKSAADLTSRFAADFDFVKTLDTNQVTLDLATQYVRLGEYDSAKRLLKEVIAQGNSEQKQQAQMMLERTA
nr:FimV/HubP family polar landmark protein [uncultured Psychrobacter sp.]